jgi:hypothetical protein
MVQIQNVRIPPDSTGKRIQHSATVHIQYSSGTLAFALGDRVTGQTTGARGAVVTVSGTISSGTIHLLLEDDSILFSDGELLLVDGTPYATVAQTVPIYAPNTMLAGGNNPLNRAYVDDQGALFTRNAEGSQQFDAFGKVETSKTTIIGEYAFTYDTLPDKFSESLDGPAASITHFPEYSGIVISCGTNATCSATKTSHLYHKYQASIAQAIRMTVAMGDSGKTNCTRRWGYFDESDGLYFEMAGTTLYAVIRSSTSGSVVETRIPQSEWNRDILNGEGGLKNISRIDLDVTNLVLWWIDFQWLGAGRVRFGIIANGQRVTCHETRFEIGTGYPYMRSGTLPIRFEQFNTGTTTSTSEMRVVCCTVACEGDFKPSYQSFTVPHILPMSTVSSYDPIHTLFSGRAKQLFKGQDNRVVILPIDFSVYSYSSPVILQLVKNPSLEDATWTIDPGPGSGFEIDGTGAATGGTVIFRKVVAPGQAIEFDLTYLFNYEQGETVKRHADINAYDVYSLQARLLQSGDNATMISCSLNWVEIQ